LRENGLLEITNRLVLADIEYNLLRLNNISSID